MFLRDLFLPSALEVSCSRVGHLRTALRRGKRGVEQRTPDGLLTGPAARERCGETANECISGSGGVDRRDAMPRIMPRRPVIGDNAALRARGNDHAFDTLPMDPGGAILRLTHGIDRHAADLRCFRLVRNQVSDPSCNAPEV
jgi:hypothetical protein